MYTPCMTVYVMKSLQEMTCIQEAVVIITINYILGTLTLKAIDWYINKSILSGSRGGVSRGDWKILGGCCRISLGHYYKILLYFWISQLKPV